MARGRGYIQLIRSNRAFRRLWLAQLISQMGDWLNTIALLTLTESLTGSGLLVGYVFITKMIPHFVLGPMAGVVADRFNRKTIMIVSDLLRAIAVLFYLFVDDPGDITLLYVITLLSMGLSAFFDPAKSATIPNIVSRRDLLTANAISGATWSLMLALGSALGGLLLELAGFRTAFLVDSATFLLSATFVWRIHIPRLTGIKKPVRLLGFGDLIDGFRYLQKNRSVLLTVLIKFQWSFTGAVSLLLLFFGEHLIPFRGSGELAVGVLFAARGLGAAIGPNLVRWLIPQSAGMIRWAVVPGFLINAAGLLLLSRAQSFLSGFIWMLVAAMGQSIMWVFSSMMLQIMLPDRFRGRVFAAEMALVTLAHSISHYLIGNWLDMGLLDPRTAMLSLGMFLILPALFWSLLQWRHGKVWEMRLNADTGYD